MAGAVGHCTLQPMANTNHKFPGYGGGGGLWYSKGASHISTNVLYLALIIVHDVRL